MGKASNASYPHVVLSRSPLPVANNFLIKLFQNLI